MLILYCGLTTMLTILFHSSSRNVRYFIYLKQCYELRSSTGIRVSGSWTCLARTPQENGEGNRPRGKLVFSPPLLS